MSKVWRIICRDARNITGNVMAMVVCAGLVVIPSLYAWFNIAGGWDPYGNVSNITVAVANSDVGYSSSTLPIQIDAGDMVVADLSQNRSLNWVFTDEDDAIEGVRSGKYYAAIVIPENFSQDMVTQFGDPGVSAELVYYSNEKENAIASIVTSKGASAVRSRVEVAFDETISQIGARVVSELANSLDDDTAASIVSSLDSTLADASTDLRRAASRVRAYSSLVDSSKDLLDSTSGLVEGTSQVGDGIDDALTDATEGIGGMAEALTGATSAVDGALSQGRASIDDVGDAVDEAFASATGTAGHAADDLRAIADRVDGTISSYESLRSSLAELEGLVEDEGAKAAIHSAVTHVDALIADQKSLRDGLVGAAERLEGKCADAEAELDNLHQLIDNARGEVDGAREDLREGLGADAESLSDSVTQAAASARQAADGLDDVMSGLAGATSSASDGMNRVEALLDKAAGILDSTADDLDDVHAKLKEALATGDLDAIRRIIGSDPEAVADFVSSPVDLERVAVYPTENNGSAMAPFYTTLSLFVGAVVLIAMTRTSISREGLEQLGDPSQTQVYFGRLAFYLVLAFLQSTLVLLGNLFFLGIQCEHPLLLLLAGWFTSFVFANLAYALVVSFGDVGKAVAVFLLVIQVAGSGGTFPVEMLPGAFRAVYPLLPFVHAMGAMREAMMGTFGLAYWVCLGRLALFLVPSLLLGLVLRRPVTRANRWLEAQLESTHVM